MQKLKNNFGREYKVGELKIGTVVNMKSADENSYGHIIGFDYHAETKELLIKVRWMEGDENSIHPARVVIEN